MFIHCKTQSQIQCLCLLYDYFMPFLTAQVTSELSELSVEVMSAVVM